MTTIATWNLHHVGKERRIPDGVTKVIEQVKADVLVLTEYVDRGGRASFKATLKQLGYVAYAVSSLGKGQNQVLVATAEEQDKGGLAAPDVDEAAETNFLHCRIPTLDLDVVGFRVPHYQSERPVQPEKLEDYWQQFTMKALGTVSKRVVFIGDFNVGIEDVDIPGQKALRKLVEAGYRMCAEDGGLDRALLSPKAKLRSFSVLESVGDYRLTGKGGLSDHAMLVVEVE